MQIREVVEKDLPQIIKMWSEDMIGHNREVYQNPLPEAYVKAFEIIKADPNHELLVLVDDNEEVLASLHLTFLQYLTNIGGVKALVENVIVRQDLHGRGMGKYIIEWAINRARTKGAHTIQLTTNKSRPGTKTFYERLGFTASHEGMKMSLN